MSATPTRVPVPELQRLAQGWLLDCEYRHLSRATIETRRDAAKKFLWCLEREGCKSLGPAEIRRFVLYLRTGHEEPEGRWGNPQARRPMSARSVKDWHVNLATLFRFLVNEGYLDGSPMDGLKSPILRNRLLDWLITGRALKIRVKEGKAREGPNARKATHSVH